MWLSSPWEGASLFPFELSDPSGVLVGLGSSDDFFDVK